MLSWNGERFLGPCLSSVSAQGEDVEILVVDNGSSDGSAELVTRDFPGVRCIRNQENLGYARGNNVGLREANGEIVVLLNQDTVVEQGWLAQLEKGLREPRAGVVGCKLLYPDGTIQHAGATMDERGHVTHRGRREHAVGRFDREEDVELLTGAALGMTRATLERIGLLDESFGTAYYEDSDWCCRVHGAGLRVLYWPRARAMHRESASTPAESEERNRWLHQGRLRLLFKHKPAAWLENEFEPRESAWLRSLGVHPEKAKMRQQYAELMRTLPGICEFRTARDGPDAGSDAGLLSQRLHDVIERFQDASV